VLLVSIPTLYCYVYERSNTYMPTGVHHQKKKLPIFEFCIFKMYEWSRKITGLSSIYIRTCTYESMHASTLRRVHL
jgi:hypothetical protein